MARVFTFRCGCSWPVAGPAPREGALPRLLVDDEHLPDCPAVWDMLGKGLTKGVFQLESGLGRQWCRRLKPTCMEHLCALGAILRPGCLRGRDADGVSMTERYCRRKNGEEEVQGIHPALDGVLRKTYGVLVYQEQILRICAELAGFDLVQQDKIRKSVGKKDQQELAKCRELFFDGCRTKGVVSAEDAQRIWSIIQKSGRYSFNRSHSMSYARLGYDTAYVKCHFPAEAFANWLFFAKEKAKPLEEIAELVEEARLFDVPVRVPDARAPEPRVHTDGVEVRFGLCDVKWVGASAYEKLRKAVGEAERALGKPPAAWDWEDYLLHVSPGGVAAKGLISAGGFGWTGKSRTRLLNEWGAWDALTEPEQAWARARRKPGQDLTALLQELARPKKEGGGCARADRAGKVRALAHYLAHPPAAELDTPDYVAGLEETYLGVALSCSRVDAYPMPEVTGSCREVLAGRVGRVVLGVEVKEAREHVTKGGKTPGARMGFLAVADGTCTLRDVVVFADRWARFRGLFRAGACVVLAGSKDPKKDGGFIVDHAWSAD